MKRVSEYVSPGHPDKVADYISEYILDRYLEQDPGTRYAVEVQIKGTQVTLGGEVSSKVVFAPNALRNFAREAVNEIGYTKEYQERWGRENTICGDEIEVRSFITQQSADIARGLANGWGDQGIFFGYAEPDPKYHYMPKDHAIAKGLCKALFESGKCGLDIKTQVVTDNGKVRKVIVACPLLDGDTKPIKELTHRYLWRRCGVPRFSYKLIVNGTGAYVQHGTIADCGTTGRKLAVDFYGGNSKVGGGSPWTKDGSKADLTLNLCARKFAMCYARKYETTVNVALACCIGKSEVDASITDCAGNVLFEGTMSLSPKDIIKANSLDKPIYASMCRWGLFGEFQKDKLWERWTDAPARTRTRQ